MHAHSLVARMSDRGGKIRQQIMLPKHMLYDGARQGRAEQLLEHSTLVDQHIDPLIAVALALYAISHHQAPAALRSRLLVDAASYFLDLLFSYRVRNDAIAELVNICFQGFKIARGSGKFVVCPVLHDGWPLALWFPTAAFFRRECISAISPTISYMIEAATIAVILFVWSLVGIRHTTSPPITSKPLTARRSSTASSMFHPTTPGSMFETPGATVGSRQSRSNVI